MAVARRGRGHPPLRLSIGVHRGPAVVGILGSGDGVDTAARVEATTRQFAVDILISAEVRADLDDRDTLRAMPAAAVKGKAEPIVTQAVVGRA